MRSRIYSAKILLLTLLLSFQAGADTVLLRAPGVALQKYNSALKSSVSKITPMSMLEQRLQMDELSPSLRKKLDATLAQVAQRPERSSEEFEKLYLQLEQEPRSAAVRDAMRMVLERLKSAATNSSLEWIQPRLSLLQATQSDQRQNTPSLLQNEIQARLRVLLTLAGGEDLELYWNGIKWNSSLLITPDQNSQWLFVSSQWQPRLFKGTWSQISNRLNEEFLDWVMGTCETPQFRTVIANPAVTAQALFPDDCLTGEEGLSKLGKNVDFGAQSKSRFFTRPIFWGAGILAAGLVFLSLSGNRIRIQH